MKRCVVAALLAVLLVSPALTATKVIGVWTGHVSFDAKHIPTPKTDKGRTEALQMFELLKKMRFSLAVRADHTFMATSTNVPGGLNRADGKWSFKGNTLTLNIEKRNGQPLKKGAVRTELLKLSTDRRTLTMPLGASKGARVVFRRM